MPPPDFIQEAETAWYPQAGGTKSTPAADYVNGDVLVAFGAGEDGSTVTAISIAGMGLTWTTRQSNIQAASCTGYLWTATSDGDLASQATVTPTLPSGNKAYGCNLLTFRNSGGIGASNKATVATGAPTMTLTTTGNNSAIVMLCVDWNAGSASGRAFDETQAGTFTEKTVDDSSAGASYTVYGGYYANAGAAGTKTIGMTAPNTQKYTLMAVEVLGTAGGGFTPTFNAIPFMR